MSSNIDGRAALAPGWEQRLTDMFGKQEAENRRLLDIAMAAKVAMDGLPQEVITAHPGLRMLAQVLKERWR